MLWKRRSQKQASDALREAVGEYKLPHFPGSVLEALSALRDPDATLGWIGERLSVDPGISVKLLSLVNSAGFGLRAPVDSLPHAVQLVGRSSLESLLVSMGVRRSLPTRVKGIDPHAFWKAAAQRAAVARRMSEILCPSEGPRAFTAALLQEMAVPLLAERHGSAYAALLERWHEGGPELRDQEQEAFGYDHAGIGLLMCQAWDLPESLAVAIGGHHQAPDAGADVPHPVLLSAFLRAAGCPSSGEAIVAAASERHAMDPETVNGILAQSLEDAEGLARMLV